MSLCVVSHPCLRMFSRLAKILLDLCRDFVAVARATSASPAILPKADPFAALLRQAIPALKHGRPAVSRLCQAALHPSVASAVASLSDTHAMLVKEHPFAALLGKSFRHSESLRSDLGPQCLAALLRLHAVATPALLQHLPVALPCLLRSRRPFPKKQRVSCASLAGCLATAACYRSAPTAFGSVFAKSFTGRSASDKAVGELLADVGDLHNQQCFSYITWHVYGLGTYGGFCCCCNTLG